MMFENLHNWTFLKPKHAPPQTKRPSAALLTIRHSIWQVSGLPEVLSIGLEGVLISF